MIITKLKGGLGNQMFQYAVSISAAIDNSTQYYFDLSFFTKPKHGGLLLDKLPQTNIKILQNVHRLPVIVDTFYYSKILNNTYLDGFWQSEKYFINNQNVIKEHFDLSKKYSNYVNTKYPFLKEDTISIHVRRGDYLKKSEEFPVQSLDYYTSAYDMLTNKQQIVILSDDIEWCKKNFKFNNMNFISGEEDIIDLYIISLCKNNIIANSSFSW
jgi:hypothetical protein